MEAVAEAGHPAHAIELPGHGTPGSNARLWGTLTSYVDALADAVAGLGPETIVVGHSMGGTVVQRFLEKHDVGLGVLVASTPHSGALGVTLRTLRRDPLTMLRVNATLSMWPLVSTKDKVRDFFFTPSSDEADVVLVQKALQNESIMAYFEMILRRPKPSRVSTPVRVIGAEHDAVFTVAEQQRLAAAYGTDLVLIEGAGHDVMVDGDRGVEAGRLLVEMLESF